LDKRIAELEHKLDLVRDPMCTINNLLNKCDKLQALLESRPQVSWSHGNVDVTEFENWDAAVDAAGVPRK